MFNSVRTIKLFNAYSTINHRFEHINSDLIEKKKKVAAYEGIIEGINNFLSSAAFVSIIGIGAFLVQKGMTNWGTVIAILAFKAMIDDLIKVGNSISSLQTSVAGVERVDSAYTEDIEVESEPISKEIIERGDKKPVITFSNVSFCYSHEKKVLDNFNFIAYSNTKVAILGPSGEGKSTIAKLIVDLYKPTSGTILLQSDVAYVPQDAFIFDDSIFNNILYGKPDATTNEVMQAAAKANVLDFVNDFPKGFETKVGENGSLLSGGQKQRIAIARAFLNDAGIIVMDEPTSALDLVSEKKVLHAIENLMEGRCTIFITHRVESIKDFDYVYRMENGQIKKYESSMY
ncbi:Multidrug resistance ABC transporter ATP-binding/permease protein BmrA [compost metagenome]